MSQLNKKTDSKHENLAGEHPWGDTGQIILFFVFMAVWIVDSFVLNLTDLSKYYLPFYLKFALAAVFLGIGIYLSKRTHDILFNSKEDDGGVISTGPFARVRHPLYLSTMLFYLALLIFNPTIISFAVGIVIFIFYNFIARHEEKILVEKFGKAYGEYMTSVPRWVPRLK